MLVLLEEFLDLGPVGLLGLHLRLAGRSSCSHQEGGDQEEWKDSHTLNLPLGMELCLVFPFPLKGLVAIEPIQVVLDLGVQAARLDEFL